MTITNSTARLRGMARARRKPRQSTEHLHLADNLEVWASRNDVSSDPIVNRLSESLRNNIDLQKWADLDADNYLPRPKPKNPRLSLFAKRLTLLRNVLVFSPVALTWAAVSEATSAFSDFTKSNPNSIANFLDFWQDGYGFLDEKWTIGAIALLDAILVGAVIVLTVVVSFINDRVRKIYDALSRSAEYERRGLVLELSHFFSDKKAINNVILNKNLVSAIYKLLNATDHIEGSARDLRKAIKEFNNAETKAKSRTSNRIPELPESIRKLLDS